MKLLQLFADAGWEFPKSPWIKDYFLNKFKNEGEDEFLKNLYWFGSRSYNEFLDYSLFAIKISNFYAKSNYKFVEEYDSFKDIEDIIIYLLFDDRHDMYQNVPYCLNRIINGMQEEKDKKEFKIFLCCAFIESINVHGDGDVAFRMSIPEY